MSNFDTTAVIYWREGINNSEMSILKPLGEFQWQINNCLQLYLYKLLAQVVKWTEISC